MTSEIGRYFKDELARIQEILPDATPMMVADFMKRHWVRLVTVRIWAEQGVLSVEGGAIRKADGPPAAPTEQERDQMMRALEQLFTSEVE